MKRLIQIVLILFISIYINAQEPIQKGEVQANAGFGFSGWGVPVYLGLDYGVHEDISIGGELSYRRYHHGFLGTKYYHDIIGILANGNYHFNRLIGFTDKAWDIYAGVSLGFYSWSSPNDYPGDDGSTTAFGLQVGARYYFTDSFGLNLELGGANTFTGGKFGVTLKF